MGKQKIFLTFPDIPRFYDYSADRGFFFVQEGSKKLQEGQYYE